MAEPITPTKPLFDMSKATPIQGQVPLFDMSKATPIGGQDAGGPPPPAKPPKPGFLDRADQAITSALAPNPQNYQPPRNVGQAISRIPEFDPEVYKTLGREAYSGVKTVANMFRPSTYQGMFDDPTPQETQEFGTPQNPDAIDRVGLAVGRSTVLPIKHAIQDYASGKVTPDAALENAPEALGSSAGTVVGGKLASQAIPLVMRGIAKTGRLAANATAPTRGALAQRMVGPLAYENVGETAADIRSGANPERGIVDEGLVGTKQGLVTKVDTRLGQLKTAANNILDNHPNSRQIIDAEPLIDGAIDDAITQAKKTGADTARLENVRTALKTQYGNLQGTPRQLNDLKSQIQESAKNLGAYKNTQPIEASAASAMSDAANRIKNVVNQQVPEAAELNQRMQDLTDARAGIQKKVNQSRGDDLFKETASNTTGTLGKMAQRTIGSAPVRTGIARILNAGNVKGVPAPMASPIPLPIRGLLGAPATPLGPSTATNPLSAPPITYPFRSVGRNTPRQLGTGSIPLGPSTMTNPPSVPPAYDMATTPLRKGLLLPVPKPQLPQLGYTEPQGEPVGTAIGQTGEPSGKTPMRRVTPDGSTGKFRRQYLTGSKR